MKETFKTVAVFQYSAEALILKGRLEAEGIPVFMKDMHTIDTDPLVSNAIGGVKVRVYAADEKIALEIINSISAYAINDVGEPIHCPKCGAPEIVLGSAIDSPKALFYFLIGFLLFLLPTYQKMKYRCQACHHKFDTHA